MGLIWSICIYIYIHILIQFLSRVLAFWTNGVAQTPGIPNSCQRIIKVSWVPWDFSGGHVFSWCDVLKDCMHNIHAQWPLPSLTYSGLATLSLDAFLYPEDILKIVTEVRAYKARDSNSSQRVKASQRVTKCTMSMLTRRAETHPKGSWGGNSLQCYQPTAHA